eukprot:20253-Heterococcus_DN1.PRE.1
MYVAAVSCKACMTAQTCQCQSEGCNGSPQRHSKVMAQRSALHQAYTELKTALVRACCSASTQ